MRSGRIQQYLPRLVREWDDLVPGQLHHSIEGSMVFVDVSGFTKMSERLARQGKLGAEEVTEVIGGTFYEEALLLLAQEASGLACSDHPDEAAREAEGILDKLQVVTTNDSASASV